MMNLKSIFVVLSVILTAGISAAGDYQVLVLGDIHHDNMKFHDLSKNPPPFHYNPQEVKRNLPNSERYQPHMLEVAARTAADTAFIIQVGDFTQGDCGSEKLQFAMLESAYNMVKKNFPEKPFYLTPGNHDYRGPGAKKAYWAFSSKYMSKETRTTVTSPDYTVRHGKDAYIFLDAAGGGAHLDFLEAELKKHQDARYRFVIGHYAFLPLPGMRSGCIFFDKGWEKSREKMMELFLKYNVIYICGHIHANAVIDYRTREGNISQLMAYSILSPGLVKPATELRGREKYSTKFSRTLPRYQQTLERMQPGIGEFYYANNPGGYVILKVNDKQVDAVFYLNWQDKPYTTVTLRKNNAPAQDAPAAVSAAPAAVKWEKLLPQIQFKEILQSSNNGYYRDPTTLRMTKLEESALGRNTLKKKFDGTHTVTLKGNPGDIVSGRFNAQLPMAVKKSDTFVLRYKASGFRRWRTPTPAISVGREVILLTDEIINDRREHTLIGKFKQDHAAGEKLELFVASDGNDMLLEWRDFAVTRGEVLPQADLKSAAKHHSPDSRMIDLTGMGNRNYDENALKSLNRYGKLVDFCTLPSAGEINVLGVPFKLLTSANNVIAPRFREVKRPAKFTVIDTVLSGADYYPQRADGLIAVPLKGKAAEVCFLMSADMPVTMHRSAAPTVPMQLRSTDVLITETVYADGTSDWAFPYSAMDKNFVVQRYIGAYAVPADSSKELKEFRLYSRYRNKRGIFNLLAVTLNADRKYLTPQVLDPQFYQVANRAASSRFSPSVKFNKAQDVLTVQNRDYSMQISCGSGFDIKSLKMLHLPQSTLSGGLEIELDRQYFSGKDFVVKDVKISGSQAEIYLQSTAAKLPVKGVITVDAAQPDRLRWSCRLQNTGSKVLNTVVYFPVFNNVKIGNIKDCWLYFPKYNVVLTDQESILQAPGNERAFFVQFFDMFNPRENAGIMFLTDNRRQDIIDYGLQKNAYGMRSFIRHSLDYHKLQPGREYKYIDTCSVFHRGDWHQALALYQAWLKTWFKPAKKHLEWWDNIFLVHSEQTKRSYHWQVGAYDEKNKVYRFDEMLEEYHKRMKTKPDFMPIYGWNHPPQYPGEQPRKGQPARDYDDGQYEAETTYGKPGQLAEAIKKLQAQNINVSLYSIPAYLPKGSPMGRKLGKEVTGVYKNGGYIQDQLCYFPCIYAWTDIYVKALHNAVSHTGSNAIYIDTFPFPRTYACYSHKHGHNVPNNSSVTGSVFLKKLRARLGNDIAIWSEDPVMDVDVQYMNGAISYYSFPVSEHRAPNYGNDGELTPALMPRQNIGRYAFPDFKTFVLFTGYDSGIAVSHFFDMFFFNGEGLYDVTYSIFDSLTLPIKRKQVAILQKYRDCFTCKTPRPLVETLVSYIFANHFTGKDREIWTVFNGRFTQYKGEVLKVPHVTGSKWYDLWNDQELEVRTDGKYDFVKINIKPQSVIAIMRSKNNK